jgi:hypothetical protein
MRRSGACPGTENVQRTVDEIKALQALTLNTKAKARSQHRSLSFGISPSFDPRPTLRSPSTSTNNGKADS